MLRINMVKQCLILFHIGMIYSQLLPLRYHSNEKDPTFLTLLQKPLLTKATAKPSPNRNPNLVRSSHAFNTVKTSTFPPLFHDLQTTVIKTNSTSEVSTFKPLLQDSLLQLLTELPDKIKTSTFPPLLHDFQPQRQEGQITSEISTYPPPYRNPNIGISLHPPNKIKTSTLPPLIDDTSDKNSIGDDDSAQTQHYTSEISTYPPPYRNPNIGISLHPPNKIKTSTLPPLIHDTSDKNSISDDDSAQKQHYTSEISTYPPPYRNPNIGISIHPPNKIKTSTMPPLIHDLKDTNFVGDSSQKDWKADAKLTSGNCPFAIIGCCSTASNKTLEDCFDRLGCAGPFWDESPCGIKFIEAALKIARDYYSKN